MIIDEITLKKLKEIKEIKQFIEFISRYYPGLNIKSYSIEEIERELFHIYIKLIGKIMIVSPRNIRIFLRNYLLKYEIMNIKRVVLGTVLGMSTTEKNLLVNKLVEELLGNTAFMKDLIEISSLDEIQLFMSLTKFNEAIREGILYFKNANEIFVLEAFLDRLYYENLQKEMKFLNKKEKEMISVYVRYISEIYNLNLIYRGIKNNIDRKLLSQFLVNIYMFLDEGILNDLMNLSSIDSFITDLRKHLSSINEIRLLVLRNPFKKKHLVWEIEKLYLNYFFKIFKIKIDDIEYSTIFRIMEVLIKKENEIKINILPQVVKILHEKYRVLK
ncbi:MAG: V-type ATPase subunit [Promethearchaeota archaeon]